MHVENELLHKNKTEYKQNATDIARTSNVWGMHHCFVPLNGNENVYLGNAF